MRGGQFIPIHGGTGDPDGEFNAIYAPFTAGKGYGEVDDGSSFIQVVTWNGSACPDAVTILSYSLSTNPLSPYSSDQTRLFGQKQWLRDRFCEADILASPVLNAATIAEPSAASVAAATALPNTEERAGRDAVAAVAASLVLGATATRRRRRRSRS